MEVAASLLKPKEFHESMSLAERHEYQRHGEVAGEVLEGIKDTLRWWAPSEGKLPDGLGRYRILLPFFELPGGRALAYPFVKARHGGETTLELQRLGAFHGFYPATDVVWSWRGFRVGATNQEYSLLPFHVSSCIVILDLVSNLDIRVRVTRNVITIGQTVAKQLRVFITQKVAEVEDAFLQAHVSSPYCWLCARLSRRLVPRGAKATWAIFGRDEQLIWKEIQYPCITAFSRDGNPTLGQGLFYSNEKLPETLCCNGHPVTVCSFLVFNRDKQNTRTVIPFELDLPPRKVVQALNVLPLLIPMWDEEPHATTPVAPSIATANFPSEWGTLLGCGMEVPAAEWVLLNRVHSITEFATKSPLTWTTSALSQFRYGDERKIKVFPNEVQRATLLQSQPDAADWLIACALCRESDRIWSTLNEQHADFWHALWRRLGLGDNQPILFYLQTYNQLLVLTPDRAEMIRAYLPSDKTAVEKYLPWPSADWRIITPDNQPTQPALGTAAAET
ncbi:MAG TPA: hypothetical protein VJN43_02085 [Bryobacteraceae bacterium]|nr:hypothetical protein [Bryobacteraceae bacterium]